MATVRTTLIEAIGFDVKDSLIDRALSKWNLVGDEEYSATYETSLLNAELDVLLKTPYVTQIKAGAEQVTYSEAGLKERIRLLAKELGRELEEVKPSYIRAVQW